jgi:hypothetical protein
MLCLSLRSSPERVYRRALGLFSVEEISEGFAAARGLALPSQLRRMLREQGQDLHAEFLRLLPERPHPIRIQRWSVRRVGLLLLVVPVAALLFRPRGWWWRTTMRPPPCSTSPAWTALPIWSRCG